MNQASRVRRVKLVFLAILALITALSFWPARRLSGASGAPSVVHAEDEASAQQQRQARVNPKSAGCLSCHKGSESMHADGDEDIGIGCADCHGGDPAATTKEQAHVKPRFPEFWKSSANPERAGTMWVKESDEFIRFVNPGDFRAADLACGKCHEREVYWAKKSMMTHGGMLWGAALYNNGAYPFKDSRFGESYGKDGAIQMVFTNPPPTPEETRLKGVLTFLQPLPRWPITQPGNILRAFERGGELKGFPSDIGSPNIYEPPGKPDIKLSDRGFGTRLRVDPVFLGLQKTRLLDPILSMLGTNDHPGDYRSSGCTACHVVYANDRDPKHSSKFAEFGNQGFTQTADPTIPKNEPGHPIKHQMVIGAPSSQCMVCHVHPGTNMVTTYYGMTWWDNETDGDLMYPEKQPDLSDEQKDNITYRNPEGSALRGKWGQDLDFLQKIYTDVNPKAKRTQFGDFHGHGWVFRKVYKTDRKGNMLNTRGRPIDPNDPKKFEQANHLDDVHLRAGMHCADCHVSNDVHGNGNLYNEPRAAIQIDCIDCHGTIEKPATLILTGPSAGTGRFGGRVVTVNKDLRRIRTRDERGRPIPMFQVATAERPIKKKDAQGREVEFKNGEIIQNSLVEYGKWWRVVQTVDTVTQGKRDYNDASAWAKLVRRDGKTWGEPTEDSRTLAHANSSMTCYACHSSWTTSCFGCHLPLIANRQKPNLHFEGDDSLRNWTQYNFQTLRDDIYMLGKDGTVTGRRVAPTRSTCAILVGSQNQNREWIYSQQQTVSAEGYSGQAFSTYVPHTVSTADTKVCTDCHISEQNNNNAWMAQLLMQGTNFTNFIGRYAWVAAGRHGIFSVVVTEREEPQAVIGSDLHKLAYPEEYAKHEKRDRVLKEAYEHHANGEALSIQVRGEYAYVANGPGGLRVYDIANIDNKGYSERFSTAPFSPIGQRFYVKSKYATAVASPTTTGVDPTRNHRPENEEAQYRDDKQPIHLMYAFLYVTDKYEGLFTVLAATLLDGDPTNNFLKRQLTFNPEGKLNGASNITIAGHYAYITADRGLIIVDINDPLNPKIAAEITDLKKPRAVQIQFRYAFVLDEEGMKVVDVTEPEKAKLVSGAVVPIEDAHNLYLVRTYAYVAAGRNGLVIVDIESPEKPKLDQTFNAGGKINDTHDVKVGMTNNSLFAYLADGRNGLHVVQLLSPAENPTIYGFSPKVTPKLIATYPMKGEALALSEGLDRDRAVDETGQQLSVFNRRGARPFNKEEMRRMYMHADGQFYTVNEDIPRRPRPPRPQQPTAAEAGEGTASATDSVSWSDFASGGLMHLFVSLLLLVGGVRTVRRR